LAKHKITSSIRTISDWLITHATHSPQGKLPSVRVAASLCHVSVSSVQSALQLLKSEGLVESRSGSGAWLKGRMPRDNHVFERRGWEWLAQELKNALRSGEWAGLEGLPSSKELVRRWNSSSPTLRKALASLHRDGFLERRGARWFWAEEMREARKKVPSLRRVILVAAAVGGRIRMETHREMEFFRYAEEECRARSLDLVLVGYDDAKLRFLSTPHSHDATVAGVILSPWHLSNGMRCLREVMGWGWPVSLWLETPAHAAWVKRWAGRSGIAFFSVGYGSAPGREVGRFLHERGHTKVAYISPFHGSEWSCDRLYGLRNVLSDVRECVHAGYRNTWSFRDEIEQEALGKKKPRDLLPRELKGVNVLGEGLLLARWREETCELARDFAILQVLQPLLQQAREYSDVTAWVCANDFCAVLARGWLEDVEPDRSLWPEIVAFDNSPDAILHGIDSYEFNTRGMLQAMLHYLLAPRNPLFRGGDVFHPKGHVVRRSL